MANGDISLPPDPTAAPDLEKFAKSLAGALSQVADFTFLKTVPTNLIAEAIALALSLPFKFLAELVVLSAKVTLDLLGTARSETDQLAGIALQELFGEGVDIGGIRGGAGGSGADGIAAGVLAQMLGGALSGGSNPGPTAAPAEHFMGMLLGVSIRAWLLEFLTDLLPESVRIAPFNDLIDGVLGALGVQRLARVALQPAIHNAVALPLQWLVLDALRPTLLAEGAAVKAFLRGEWTRQQLEDELGAKGYSSERIDQVVKDTKNFISQADVLTLVRNGVWTEEQAATDFQERGYSNGEAQAIILTDHLAKVDALHTRAIAAYELQWKRGKLDDGGFVGALTAMHERDDVAAFWLEILKAEQAAGFKILDKAQLDQALQRNVISLPEWRAGLVLLGYHDDDVTILEMTEQATIASKEQAAQLKAQKAAEAAAAKAAAKQAAAAAKAQAAAEKAAKAAAAAAAKKTAAAAKQDTLLAKQQLLAQQAQARRDQIAKAQEQKLITTAEAQQALAGVVQAENAAAAAVNTQKAIATQTANETTRLTAAQLTASTVADQATRDAQAATVAADAQAAALQERRQERIANYQAQRDQVDQEEQAGLLTANAAQKKRDTIATAEKAAVAAERLDQLAIARAQAAAKKTAATAAAKAAKASAAVSLIPTATARTTAIVASSAAQLAQVKATGGAHTAAAKAQVAAAQAGALDTATSQLDALNAQLLAEFQAFEKQHGPA